MKNGILIFDKILQLQLIYCSPVEFDFCFWSNSKQTKKTTTSSSPFLTVHTLDVSHSRPLCVWEAISSQEKEMID